MQLENLPPGELIALATDIRRILKVKHTWYERERPDWDTYFTMMANTVSSRGGCCRRRVGAVMVDQDHRTLSTGYNGKAAGLVNCLESPCAGASFASGEGLASCEAIHAEVNALIQCPDVREIHTAYLTCSPCINCVDILLGTGCARIVFTEAYAHNTESERRWRASGREWVHWKKDQTGIEAKGDPGVTCGPCGCSG